MPVCGQRQVVVGPRVGDSSRWTRFTKTPPVRWRRSSRSRPGSASAGSKAASAVMQNGHQHALGLLDDGLISAISAIAADSRSVAVLGGCDVDAEAGADRDT